MLLDREVTMGVLSVSVQAGNCEETKEMSLPGW